MNMDESRFIARFQRLATEALIEKRLGPRRAGLADELYQAWLEVEQLAAHTVNERIFSGVVAPPHHGDPFLCMIHVCIPAAKMRRNESLHVTNSAPAMDATPAGRDWLLPTKTTRF
jgi:hypothetical protein